jgi:hypothetical protein
VPLQSHIDLYKRLDAAYRPAEPHTDVLGRFNAASLARVVPDPELREILWIMSTSIGVALLFPAGSPDRGCCADDANEYEGIN